MTPIKPSQLSYVLLTRAFRANEYAGLYQQAYEFWYQSWCKVYAENRFDKVPSPDDFFRQDYIPVILFENQIIGIHHYTLYDFRVESTSLHSYVKQNFSTTFIPKCRALGLGRMMSMESLFVDYEFRKSKVGVQLSEVLISLGQRVLVDLTDAQSIFTPARNDKKVSETAYKLGFEPVEREIMLYNTPVDLMICRRERVVPIESEGRLFAEYLWRNRVDPTAETQTFPRAA